MIVPVNQWKLYRHIEVIGYLHMSIFLDDKILFNSTKKDVPVVFSSSVSRFPNHKFSLLSINLNLILFYFYSFFKQDICSKSMGKRKQVQPITNTFMCLRFQNLNETFIHKNRKNNELIRIIYSIWKVY